MATVVAVMKQQQIVSIDATNVLRHYNCQRLVGATQTIIATASITSSPGSNETQTARCSMGRDADTARRFQSQGQEEVRQAPKLPRGQLKTPPNCQAISDTNPLDFVSMRSIALLGFSRTILQALNVNHPKH